MANHHRIWTNKAFIWSGGQAGWVATVLKEKTRGLGGYGFKGENPPLDPPESGLEG